MTKRKRAARWTVRDMPYLVEGLALEADWMREQPQSPEAPSLDTIDGLAQGLRDPVLWWVTEPMTRLAFTYAPELPAWDFEAVRPSLSGVLLWDGSSGLGIDMDGAGNTDVPIQGVVWATGGGSPFVQPLIRARLDNFDPPSPMRGLSMRTLSLRPQHQDGGFGRLWALVGATMILAQTETVATRHRERVPGPPHPRRPALPTSITQITLRERIRSIADQDPDAAEGGKKWTLKNRHLVRGHWRQQACGPNRELRKPTFVPPYIKGPADGELKVKTAIHVWRR